MPFRSSGRGAYGPQGQRVLKGPLAPVWVTGAGQVGTANLGAAVSVQLSATDDSGDAPTYTIASGSLPTGLSLSSSGLISGTLGGSAGTFTFTVNATDVNGRATTSGSFTFLSVQPGWSALTITTSSTGQSGPTSTGQVSMAATGSAPVYSLDSGYIDLTVPITGTYRIEVFGARSGATPSCSAVAGARMRGDFSLTAGNILKILVGQIGTTSSGSGDNTRAGGGGGGTFVALGNNRASNTLLIAAGGGASHSGGGCNSTVGTTSETPGSSNCGSNGTQQGGGACGTSQWGGGGGGGFVGNGTSIGSAGGGVSYRNGGTGGSSGGSNGNGPGGFGGGGGGQLEGGGGGGYSGGGGGNHGWGSSGGGGSFNSGSNQSNTAGGSGGAGQVILTRL